MLLRDFVYRFFKKIISEDSGWLHSHEFKKSLSRQVYQPFSQDEYKKVSCNTVMRLVMVRRPT